MNPTRHPMAPMPTAALTTVASPRVCFETMIAHCHLPVDEFDAVCERVEALGLRPSPLPYPVSHPGPDVAERRVYANVCIWRMTSELERDWPSRPDVTVLLRRGSVLLAQRLLAEGCHLIVQPEVVGAYSRLCLGDRRGLHYELLEYIGSSIEAGGRPTTSAAARAMAGFGMTL